MVPPTTPDLASLAFSTYYTGDIAYVPKDVQGQMACTPCPVLGILMAAFLLLKVGRN
jgi:hypothetical protein